jgi:hypothetical protein
MVDDSFIFWTICISSLFVGKIISNFLFPEPAKFLEAYGGCDCGRDICEKIDTFEHRGKSYRRIDIQESKMTYKYCKIYNVTQGKYAYDVSGDDDPKVIWETNDWNENDALIGFYETDDCESYEVIFCRPGYAIYVQSEQEKDRDTYKMDDNEYRLPPAMLVNLNNAYDTDFLHSKNYPSEMECEDDDESMSEDESDDESDEDSEADETRCHTHIPENQRVIDFLYKCRDATDNQFKKNAYDNAINEFHSYWNVIYPKTWKPCTIGESIERKIREFLMGVPEDDIINS